MKETRILAAGLLVLVSIFTPAKTTGPSSLRFEVTVASGLISSPRNGRLFVVMSPKSQPEPRLTIGRTGLDASPVFGRDLNSFGIGVTGVIDDTCVAFPIESLARLPAGDYFVQALFDSNIDLKSVNAPGNLYSTPRKVHLDPGQRETVKIEITERVADEQLPPDTDYVKHVKIQSTLLSKFHGRPIYLRAGVILPKGFDSEPAKRFPLRVHIGGYGSRFTNVQRMMGPGSSFRNMWLSEGTPRMVFCISTGMDLMETVTR